MGTIRTSEHHFYFLPTFQNGVRALISRDSFCAPEVDIFRAVNEWVVNNAAADEDTKKSILACVRLSLLSTQDLLKVVRPTGLVPPDIMLDAIQSKEESRDMDLKYRGYMRKVFFNFCETSFVFNFLPF